MTTEKLWDHIYVPTLINQLPPSLSIFGFPQGSLKRPPHDLFNLICPSRWNFGLRSFAFGIDDQWLQIRQILEQYLGQLGATLKTLSLWDWRVWWHYKLNIIASKAKFSHLHIGNSNKFNPLLSSSLHLTRLPGPRHLSKIRCINVQARKLANGSDLSGNRASS